MSASARRWWCVALALVVAHAALGRALAHADFMGALASARHGRLGLTLAFGLFVALRLIATLLVPAVCLAWASLVGWDAVHIARFRDSA